MPTIKDNSLSVRPASPRVGLFVTCLVDLFRPSIGFAAVKLLETHGCRVDVPVQTCCGQPAYNSGDQADSRDIAKQVITAFAGFDYVVAPSGSCGGMLKVHYPEMFASDPLWQDKAAEFAGRCHELVSFLTDVLGVTRVDAEFAGRAAYHDSCSGLRELGIREQPRKLLAGVRGLELKEMHGAAVCCGFGGTFCVKYPEISGRMVSDKTQNIRESGASTILGGDFSCLMNIAGRLKREGTPVKAYHVAEVLAGLTGIPAIGESEEDAV